MRYSSLNVVIILNFKAICCYGHLVTNLMQLDLSVFVLYLYSSVQSLIHVHLFGMTWTAACQSSLSITNSQSSLKFMSIKLVMPSNHLTSCLPLLLLPSICPNIRVFHIELVLPIRWANNWSFSFSISSSSEYSGLISFRMDWFDLLAVKGLSRVFSHTIAQRAYTCVICQ